MQQIKHLSVNYASTDKKSADRDLSSFSDFYGHNDSKLGPGVEGVGVAGGGGRITTKAGDFTEMDVDTGGKTVLLTRGSFGTKDARFNITFNSKGKLLNLGESFKFSGKGKLRQEFPDGGQFDLTANHSK